MKETYEDLKNLLYQTAHKFQKMHGGDFEELVSIANLSFVEAYKSYSPEAGAITTWVRFCVWHNMLDHLDKEIKSKRTRAEDKEQKITHHRPLIDFLDDLSNESEQIINLVLSTPPELQTLIDDTGGEIKLMKKTISKYLQSIGWGRKKIKRAFVEIRDAL